MQQTVIDSREFRNALGRFATGVTVMTTVHEGETHGMTANAFMSVSLEPRLVLVSVMNTAHMFERLKASGRYGVSVLTEAQEHLSQHFAGRPQEDLADPFFYHDDIPLIKDADVHLIATVVDAHEAGDHTLFIGEVDYLFYNDETRPLLFYAGRYAQLKAAD